MRDKFTVYVKFRLTTMVRCFYINVIHLSSPSDIRDNLKVEYVIFLRIY